MGKEKEAYSKLFEQIDKDSYFKSGIDDIVYMDNQAIATQWEHLKKAVFENQTVFIRGYGRDAKGTELYFKLYEKMFENTGFKK